MLLPPFFVILMVLEIGSTINYMCNEETRIKNAMCENIFVWDKDRQVFASLINETVSPMVDENYRNFKYKTINVVTADMLPYVMYDVSSLEIYGYLADVWHLVQQRFNFSYKVRSESYSEGLNSVSSGKADVMLGSVVFKDDLLNVYYSHPYFYSWYQLYYKTLEAKPLTLVYLKVFNYNLWISVWAVFTLLMTSLWFTSKVLSKFYREERHVSMGSCFLGILAGFINQGSDLKLRSYSARLQMMVALVFGVVLYYALNAALVAKLAVLEVPRPFSSLPDIAARRDLSLCLRTNSFVHNNFTDENKVVLPEWRGVLNNEHCMDMYNHALVPKMVCKDKVVVLENKVIMRSLAKISKFPCKVDVYDKHLFTKGNSFLMAKPLKEKRLMDNYVLQMRSMGILQRLQSVWIENTITDEYMIKSPVEVTMEHTKAVFFFYSCAILLSLIILGLEILYHRHVTDN